MNARSPAGSAVDTSSNIISSATVRAPAEANRSMTVEYSDLDKGQLPIRVRHSSVRRTSMIFDFVSCVVRARYRQSSVRFSSPSRDPDDRRIANVTKNRIAKPASMNRNRVPHVAEESPAMRVRMNDRRMESTPALIADFEVVFVMMESSSLFLWSVAIPDTPGQTQSFSSLRSHRHPQGSIRGIASSESVFRLRLRSLPLFQSQKHALGIGTVSRKR
ncbi:MAG: hypothetical protein BWY66_00055 [bacterium ADurb.Bin374]|nr:MAG: hypothetical protein BWY66_00055 [bacterium ADurb.Bin374]